MNINNELEAIARECAALRKRDRDPQAALAITQKVIDTIDRRPSRLGYDRILCTHGGALRQLGKSPKALEYAELAIVENKEHKHPYNLAGASCYDLGMFDKGKEFFKIAKEKGASDLEIARMMASGRKRHKEGIKKNFIYDYEEYCDFDAEEMEQYQDEENRLIHEELTDYSDSMEASSEDGWFYRDEDS